MPRQHPIPVFGAWESDTRPTYTLIFDNARAQKGSTKINPNDPEFFSMLQEQQTQPLPGDEVGDAERENPTKQQAAPARSPPRPQPVSKRVNKRKDHGNLDSFPSTINAGLSDIGKEAGILSQTNDIADEETHSFSSSSSAESALSYGVKASGNRIHPRSVQMRSDMVDDNQLAMERPEADHRMKENKRSPQSPLHPTAYQGRLGNRAGTHGYSRSMPGQVAAPSLLNQRMRAGNTRTDETQAVLPPFGTWEDPNSVSSEEYTAIFTVLREEKKTGIPARASPLHSETPTKEVGRQPAAPRRKSALGLFLCCRKCHVNETALQSA